VKDLVLGDGLLRKYSGTVNDAGQPHGLGELVVIEKGHKKEGRVYLGVFKSGEMHGHVRLQCPDGANAIGLFKRDQFHGVAEVVQSSGARFRGQYVAGKRSGWAEYTFINGKTRVGMMEDDELKGFAVECDPRGAKEIVKKTFLGYFASSPSGSTRVMIFFERYYFRSQPRWQT
jgi:hypothetical protein